MHAAVPAAEAYVPAAHCRQSDPLLANCPESQFAHAVASLAADDVPAAQLEQTAWPMLAW